MKYIWMIILICSVLLNGYLVLRQKDYRRTMNSIINHLDRSISGTEQEVKYDESVDAAITGKLNQLVSISKINCEEANKDKNLVQSLISDISHQVKTPLTNIMLYAGILAETSKEKEEREMAGRILKHSDKLDFFMKELMKSSYLETELISVHSKKASIDELIAQACQAVEVMALKKQIVLSIQECDQSGVFDMKWTKEALVNVLDNAIKYSPEQSLIRIETDMYERFFCIKVTDQGIGIAEEEQGAIFKRFYRSPAVADKQGIGVGLYLVREIISKQNGYVKVKSSFGTGTTFSIYLPREV